MTAQESLKNWYEIRIEALVKRCKILESEIENLNNQLDENNL